MEPAVQLGLELPPVGLSVTAAACAAVSAAVCAAVSAAARAGFGTVWLRGSTVQDRRRGRGAADPGTLAAALGMAAPGIGLGVVWDGPDDRHPAVLAREVTTLDILTGGRAAVMLRWDGDSDGALEYLLEAAAVCRLVFAGGHPVFEGRVLHVAGAVNRPAPVRSGAPPILVALPPEWWADLGPLRGSAHLLASAAAVVCSTGAGALGPWRAALARLRPAAAAGGPWPALVWRPSGEAAPGASAGAASGVIVPLSAWDGATDEMSLRALAARWRR